MESSVLVPAKEDSIKEESSAGKKKKKNKANLQEKLKQLNDKLNMLNALNKKIESKTGVAASPVLLPLASPAQANLMLNDTGEDELSDSKKRKTRPNTLYDDYEIDATSRPLKKIVRTVIYCFMHRDQCTHSHVIGRASRSIPPTHDAAVRRTCHPNTRRT